MTEKYMKENVAETRFSVAAIKGVFHQMRISSDTPYAGGLGKGSREGTHKGENATLF